MQLHTSHFCSPATAPAVVKTSEWGLEIGQQSGIRPCCCFYKATTIAARIIRFSWLTGQLASVRAEICIFCAVSPMFNTWLYIFWRRKGSTGWIKLFKLESMKFFAVSDGPSRKTVTQKCMQFGTVAGTVSLKTDGWILKFLFSDNAVV